MTATTAAGLDYAARGWPVFPCWPGQKEPSVLHGFKDASTDPDQIRAWFDAVPTANIAIATGAPGPDVLDVEGPDKPGGTGFPALNRIRAAGLAAGAQALVTTPSRGLHLYYVGTAQRSGDLSKTHHVEVKATGGYVIAPPSTYTCAEYAGAYVLDDLRHATGTVDWPAIVGLLRPPPRRARSAHQGGSGTAAALAAWLGQQTNGNRNSALYWAACRLAEAGGDPQPLADVAVSLGLDARTVARTIDSASRAPARKQHTQ